MTFPDFLVHDEKDIMMTVMNDSLGNYTNTILSDFSVNREIKYCNLQNTCQIISIAKEHELHVCWQKALIVQIFSNNSRNDEN